MKMMKKVLIFTLIAALGVTIGTGWGFFKKKENKKEPLRILNGKVEIDSALKAYAEIYEKKTGQSVTIDTIGGGVDANATLKGYLLSGNMPDIFTIGGDGFPVFGEYLSDLSGEDWIKNTSYAYKIDKKVYGFPYAVEGFGIAYNADILKKAGIDPKSLTNYGAYKTAFEKLDSLKEKLGLTSVASVAAESGNMWWSTGIHMFGHYLSGGEDRTDKKIVNLLNEGKIDKQRMSEYADFVELLFKYSDKNVLISGSYDDQLALFAQGKAVFITQGNWIDPSLPKYNVAFASGIAPFAFTKNEMTGVQADCPSWWVVYKDSKNIKAAKKFLEFVAASSEGQKALVKDCGMISPFVTTTVTPDTPLAKDLMGYIKAKNTYAWDWSKMPDGMGKNAIAPVFYLFAKGDINKDEFVSMLGSNIADFIKNK